MKKVDRLILHIEKYNNRKSNKMRDKKEIKDYLVCMGN